MTQEHSFAHIFLQISNSIYTNLQFYLDILPKNYMNLRQKSPKKKKKKI